ncbi:MAG: bifunctional nuclease family protein [Candidatus Aenigmarchaeota archaeon]|nr:bifunctional nuclease family protein [Candidatus Aenigmarchaeota archaeon]
MAKRKSVKRHHKKVSRNYNIPFFAGLLLIVILSFFVLGTFEYFNTDEYVKADITKVIGNTVIIGNNCTAIVAQTSPERAHSIELGLENKIEVRPNTHDVFVDVLKGFNITVESVTMDKYEDEIYYATMHLRRGNTILNIDLKPSDGIAIALRASAPIYIKKDLLEEMGQNICK